MENQNHEQLRHYYAWHVLIYDLTRWTFRFGRREILRRLGIEPNTSKTLLEAGCGTGFNLRRLSKQYPKLNLIGVDISPDMLKRAEKTLDHPGEQTFHFIESPYAPGAFEPPLQPDMVLFSYALTMFNPGWEQALEKAKNDLPVGGLIAVVDFNDTPRSWFRRWMGHNHVRMENHLLPVLSADFSPVYQSVRKAYGGLWSYFLFVGEKR